MKYNLNLTRDYCRHWTVENAIRELIANTLDEEGTIEIFPHNELDNFVTVAFKNNRFLSPEAFILGNSSKLSKNPIGQYGEGLKLAILVLLREGVEFKITSGKSDQLLTKYVFDFEVPETLQTSIETLHLHKKQMDLVIAHSDNTRIEVFNINKDMLDKLYVPVKCNSLITNKVGLYCQGLLVNAAFSIRDTVRETNYGLNLDTAVTFNRDRNSIVDFKVIANTLEQLYSPEDFCSIEITDKENIYKALSDTYAQQVAKAYLHKYHQYSYESLKDVRVIFPEYYHTVEYHYRYEKGILIPRIYWHYGSYLHRNVDCDILRNLVDNILDAKQEIVETSLKDQLYNDINNEMLRLIASKSNIFDIVRLLTTYIPIGYYQRESLVDLIKTSYGDLIKTAYGDKND